MGKIVRLTESQLKNIVNKVITEQFSTPQMGYLDPFRAEKARQDTNSKQRIDNIANTLSYVKDGIIVNPSSKLNNTKWIDYITTYRVTPQDIQAANSVLSQRKTAQNTQNQRYVNIARTMSQVDPTTTIIKSTTPGVNGMSWVDYITKYKVTQDDINKAQAYVASLSKTNPNAAENVAAATKASAGVAVGSVKPKPDPKVLEIQKSLGFTGKDLDGIMGAKTRAAMAQKPEVKRILDTNPIPLAKSKPLTTSTIDASKLAKLPSIQGPQSNVSPERRQEIASKIEKQAGTCKLIYKGGDLNPEEQQFLNTYVQSLGGGELDKSKDKGYGQKMVYNN